MRLRELGHTYLTMLALSDVRPKVMQELAGHCSPQITMDIYTHVNMDAKRENKSATGQEVSVDIESVKPLPINRFIPEEFSDEYIKQEKEEE